MKTTLNTSKSVLKVTSGNNENVSNIPQAIARPRALGTVRPYRGTLTRSSSLRNKSVNKIINFKYNFNNSIIFQYVDCINRNTKKRTRMDQCL